MQETTHYALQKPEGTDNYNKATDNANMDAIDAQMYANAQAAAAAQSTANAAVPASGVGQANGVASLGADGKLTPTEMPIASDSVVGGVKAGANVTIAADGSISAPAPTDPYVLPSDVAKVDTVQTWTAAQAMPLAEGSTLAGRDSIPNYNQYMSSPDANGIYTVVQLKRNDGTLYMQSTLSNADTNLNYQTDTWQFYDSAGTTVIATHVWSITYDANNKISQKVMTS